MRPQSDDAVNDAEIQDKALNLRESVNSSRARMSAQKERLERLRREIAELRALVGQPASRPAPVLKEAAPVSAAGTVSSKTDSCRDSWRPAPYVAIFFAAVGLQVHASRPGNAFVAPVAAPAAATVAATASPRPSLDDGGADEALLLAHDWRLPGDERTLSERLGADTNPPGSQPQWTAERTGERTYRVTFKASDADDAYDFDVDLAGRRVDPTPETAELISPRLVSR